MHIQLLSLTNFRGAESVSFEFDSQLNVFAGVNGAGKSTVLDAIAIMLSWTINRIQRSGTSGSSISEDDITNRKPSASIEMTIVDEEESRIGWRLMKSRKGYSSSQAPSSLMQLNEYAKKIQTRITDTEGKFNIPVFVYYPVDRAVSEIPLRIRGKQTFDLMTAYDHALKGGSNFKTFFKWFREREDLENENRKYLDSLAKPQGFVFPDPQLEAVRNALNRFLPEFQNLTVRRNPLRMEIQKHGQPFKINQLSDGEKCLIAMVSDLARRLAIANPQGNPLDGCGIVFVDEIDLHLHPKWQRIIISRLLSIFPNCQFILSTHSPHILTHIHPENIFILKQIDGQMKVSKPSESYGKSVDRILEDLMDLDTTRPKEVESSLRHIFDLLEENNLDEARQEIGRIKQKIGEDPDLVKAEVLIRRKELIGR